MAIEETETGNLIGSDKVQGTAVYGDNDEKIGSIASVMIEKRKSFIRRAGFRRNSRHRRRSLPAPLELAEIRHSAWRL